VESLRLQITEGMRRFLDYPKFRGAPRILILETQYFFDNSWLRAAEKLGWQVATVRSAMTGSILVDDIRELFTQLGEFKPDFILTSNFAGMDVAGMFENFFNDARIPYVSWFTDTPRMILFNRSVRVSDYMVAATWERAYTPHFHNRGFQHVHYMPLATDPALFRGDPLTDCARDLAFVGVSMIELAEEAWEKVGQNPPLAEALREALDSGRVNRDTFVAGVESVLPESLWRSLDSSERRNAELTLLYESTRRRRAEVVTSLLPLGLEVRGDEAWQHVTGVPSGRISYLEDLAGYYRDTAININTTSLQMTTAVNQRVFDCPAAGGFVITDDQAAVHELFDDNEVVVYASLDELRDKVRYYRTRPTEREAVIRAAQRRIAADHTHANRLQGLVAFLRERFG